MTAAAIIHRTGRLDFRQKAERVEKGERGLEISVQLDVTDNRPLGVSVDHYTPMRLQTEDQLPLALIRRLKPKTSGTTETHISARHACEFQLSTGERRRRGLLTANLKKNYMFKLFHSFLLHTFKAFDLI